MSEKVSKESKYIFSRPKLGSDPAFGSDRESGCDMYTFLLYKRSID